MKTLLTLICLLAVALSGSIASAEATFETLPDLGTTFFGGVGYLNYDGTAMSGAWQYYFYWTESGGIVELDPGVINGIYRVSEDGLTVACNTDNLDGLDAAATWTMADGFMLQDLIPDAAPCGSSISTAYDMNFDGTIGVGLAWVGCSAVAYKWTEGVGAVNLGSSGNSSRATGVSADGTVTVGFDEHPEQGYRRPAIWTDDIVGPQLLLGEDTVGECYDASSDGSKVCGVATAPEAFVSTAFYWDTDVGYVDIGHLPGDEDTGSVAFDISDDGKVVGFSSNPFFGYPRAIIWTPEDGLMPLDEYLAMVGVVGYDGQYLYNATSISADGNVIVGNYEDGIVKGCFLVRLNGVVAIDDPEDDLADPDDTPELATRVDGAYPNPFNPMTTVKFSLAHDQQIRLSVVDMTGRRVAELASGVYGAGEHPVIWNGTDAAGRAVASGTYLIHLETEEGLKTGKMMLVR
jgi:uncharacterized membrane protein